MKFTPYTISDSDMEKYLKRPPDHYRVQRIRENYGESWAEYLTPEGTWVTQRSYAGTWNAEGALRRAMRDGGHIEPVWVEHRKKEVLLRGIDVAPYTQAIMSRVYGSKPFPNEVVTARWEKDFKILIGLDSGNFLSFHADEDAMLVPHLKEDEEIYSPTFRAEARLKRAFFLREGVGLAIDRRAYLPETEKEYGDAIAAALTDARIPFEREFPLGGKAVDFMVAGLAIELKIKGGLAEITRQISGYMEHDAVAGLLLVSTKMQHSGIPTTMSGKPCWYMRTKGGAF